MILLLKTYIKKLDYLETFEYLIAPKY